MQRIHTVVISTQHDEFIAPQNGSEDARKEADQAMLAKIKEDILEHVIPHVLPQEYLKDTLYHINPTGKFIIGGPHEMLDSPEEKLLSIPMEEKEHMVVGLFQGRIQPR